MDHRLIGTTVRGLRTPIISEGSDIIKVAVDTVLNASEAGHFNVQDRDILTITESVVARSLGNYATLDDIKTDIEKKLNNPESIGIVFPILSRNRYYQMLRAISRSTKKVTILLSYPSDEVGNALVSVDQLDDADINPYTDTLSEEEFRKTFGPELPHVFTGVDYPELYKEAVIEGGAEVEIVFSNKPQDILKYTDNVIVSDIHTRERTRRLIKKAGGKNVIDLTDLMNEPIDGSGFNAKYGLLGSNQASEETIKLFPENAQSLVEEISDKIFDKTGKRIEVMVFGDGAFKDPVGKIWELADPVVSPAFTEGLSGTPNEVKLKYLADNDFQDLEGEELNDSITAYLRERNEDEDSDNSSAQSLGTTPRQITDLLGSLSDLTSGSGDKGTPMIYIQGYFDNYADED